MTKHQHGIFRLWDTEELFSQMNVPLVSQPSESSHGCVKQKHGSSQEDISTIVLNVLMSSTVPALTPLMCCADNAAVHLHAASFSLPLSCKLLERYLFF